ncbi:MAG TPA: N-acetylmuramoyl-L-alanine amidase [Candidatus Polarisedimenticolia bacterium]|jgi:N-acetylmuramoyl-L-alanine amidase|nr:N-acetylmuramoyl-L-alanine amidase [Candidatus Polarisedimenticolia bacterium]
MNIGPRTLTRKTFACALACLLLAPASTFARTVAQKKQAARAQLETAERLRDSLESKPETQRTRRDFQKVIDAYRKVYYTAPSLAKADVAVQAVAELLEDQGRLLSDPKSFKDAIGQLVFLRREYPGSKFRAEALFTIGEIYRDDLDDAKQAKATFEDFVKHYPGNSRAQEARKAIAEIDNPSVAKSPFQAKAPRQRPGRQKSLRAAEEAPKAPIADDTPDAPAQPQQQDAASVSNDSQPHRLARLTGIRHWSTGDYTRIAIDLEQEVKYQSGRVPHPDRIFFDLYGTKLASELVGKSFEVDAGFLHKIRVAQYKLNMARVVLDVDDVAEYSAFLLPNPYRLIIDIHGKMPPNGLAGNKEPRTVPQEAKPQSPETKRPTTDADAGQDVTITSVKPSDDKPSSSKATGSASADVQDADAGKSVPLRGHGKDKDKDKERVVTQTPAETAKVVTPKITVDEGGMEDSGRAAGKPTSGPTFESIAPKESSRNKRKNVEPTSRASAATTRTAAPNAAGERSLIRALGLKIGKIVVDAGHGGHDTGTIGPNGLEEKDLVLDVALKLGKLLENKLGAEVVYTRDDDTFIPLETRTAIANKEQADLFISIHANSSDDPTARGVETYYLNFTSRADALEVAARENAVSEQSIHELQDLVKKIALKEKIGESREFATDVQRSLYAGLSAKSPSLRNRGVKKAPFVVLIGANMPSILAEISFVSNPDDAKKLKTNEYRQRIADSLYKGVFKYVNSLSGVKVASKNSGSSFTGDDTTSVAAAK